MPSQDEIQTFHAANRTPRQLLTIVAGVLMAAGCFMPWASILTVRIIGTDGGDGWVFVALVALIAFMQFDKVERGFVQVILGTGALLLWAYEYTRFRTTLNADLPLMADLAPRIDVGLWVILAAALTITGTAISMLLAERRQSTIEDVAQDEAATRA